MIEPLSTVLVVALLVLALVVGAYVALDRSPDKVLLGLVAVFELALLVLAVLGIVEVARGVDLVGSAVVYVGYLLGALLVLPAGVVWSLSERSRGATAALIVAAVTTAFLVLRAIQLHG